MWVEGREFNNEVEETKILEEIREE